MKNQEPYAPEISITPALQSSARRAYWAALPPALRALISHMIVWLRVYGPVLAFPISFQSMDTETMIQEAQTRLHPALDRHMPTTRLKARQISMVTALYGFNLRYVPPPSPKRRLTPRQRIIRARRSAVRLFQRISWTWHDRCVRLASTLTPQTTLAGFGHALPILQKPP